MKGGDPVRLNQNLAEVELEQSRVNRSRHRAIGDLPRGTQKRYVERETLESATQDGSYNLN